MAINALVGVSNSCVVNGQVVNGVVTVYNSGSSALTVQAIQLLPGALASDAMNSINVNGPGMVNALPGPGNVSFPFSFVAYCGLQPTTVTSTEFAFSIGALVYTSDGSVTSATTATVQCTAPQSAQTTAGAFPFTPSPGPLAATAVAVALPGQYPNTPVSGQVRFDSNLTSGLLTTLGV